MFAAILLYFLFVMYYRAGGEFRDNKFQLAVGFTAKNYCSCLFVVERSEEECREYAALDLISPKLSVDYKNKATKSTFSLFISREAQFLGGEKGCVLL